jgi:hypothetical protein
MNNQVSDTDSGLFIFRYKKTKYNQQIEALVKELKKKIADYSYSSLCSVFNFKTNYYIHFYIGSDVQLKPVKVELQ